MKRNFWRTGLGRATGLSGTLLWGTGFIQQFADEVEERQSAAQTEAYHLNQVGLAHIQQAEYSKALQAFEKAIWVRPDYAAAYHNLAATFGVL